MECEEVVASVGNRFAGVDIRIGDVVVGRLQIVVLQVFAFEEDGIHHLVTAEVDGEYRFPIGSLDSSGHIAVDDIACIGHTGERCRDICVEGFRFCEEVHGSLFRLDSFKLVMSEYLLCLAMLLAAIIRGTIIKISMIKGGFMALISCPECEKQISETAESCPECGYKLTAEVVASVKKDEAEVEKQPQKTTKPGCVVALGIVLVILLVKLIGILLEEDQNKQSERSTSPSTYSSPSSTPKTQKVEPIGHEEWLGTWFVESIGGQPTGLYLAAGIESDTFTSWDWTFYASGRFKSKLLQSMGERTMTTTFSGTYHVSGNKYETKTSEAIMSFPEKSISMSDKVEYQNGTWSRTENTLNLMPNGWPTMVFKRR